MDYLENIEKIVGNIKEKDYLDGLVKVEDNL